MSVSATEVLRLARHVRFRHDDTRRRWVLLAPERVFEPDEIAVDVLRRIDGQTTVGTIANGLAAEYDAPEAEILADILVLLQELKQKGVLI
jgi:pyrroloquinoline quinone biosynthesis protein D